MRSVAIYIRSVCYSKYYQFKEILTELFHSVLGHKNTQTNKIFLLASNSKRATPTQTLVFCVKQKHFCSVTNPNPEESLRKLWFNM